MPRLSLWLFIAASIGSACSLTSPTDDPARGVEFVIVPQPVARCDDPTYSPNCGLRYTGILTHRSTYEVGVPPSASEFLHLSFDDSLQTFELGEIAQVHVPLVPGERYAATVELVPTSGIGLGAFTAVDDSGLVFFATTEIVAGRDLNPDLPEGWHVSTREGDYDEHAVGCGVRSTPQILVVEHEGESVELVQGEARRLGNYVVNALIVEDVDYSNVDCLDFTAPEVSYTISKVAD